nr:MAG TPA: hypothetical protein [Caudoviricetes sp.]DAS63574.1 MAG TPA: hypothetical protein [Caudoviricetes sp.]
MPCGVEYHSLVRAGFAERKPCFLFSIFFFIGSLQWEFSNG